ncbi:hypothetical protein ABK040_012123 [Willaertia magna]
MYQLVYFDSAGRAEICKLIAHVGKVTFTTKYHTYAEWPEIKQQFLWGMLPVLKRNDDEKFELYQSTAIARHLAKEGNLYPTDLSLASKSEEYVMSMYDSSVEYVRAIYSGEDKKVEEITKYLTGNFVQLLTIFEKILESTQCYLLGNELYWCDLFLLDFILFAEVAGGDISLFTNVVEWKKRVENVESVKSFFDSEHNLRKIKQ